MKSTAKAQAMSRDLADKFRVRFAGSSSINTVREAMDANGWPMIFLSHNANEAAGQAVVGLRISNVDAVSKDILGNSEFAYAPHILEIAYELTAADNPIAIDADIFKAEFEAIRLGCRVQLKELANGTAVSEANMNAASPSVDIEDLYWPAKSV